MTFKSKNCINALLFDFERLHCIDDEIPQFITIDILRKRLFCITQTGQFSVWHMETLELLFSKNFAKQSNSIYSFKDTNKILIAFENEVIYLI